MSHAPERCQTDEDADSAATAASEPRRVLALPRVADSSFDTLENQFFTEGDALNTGPAVGSDAWDEPTVICGPRHRKQQQRVRWIALSASAGMLCAGLFLWYTNSHARRRNVVVVAPAAAAPTVALPPSPDPTVVAGPAHPLPEPPAPVASPSPRPLSPADEAAGAVLSPTESGSLDACRRANGQRRAKAVLADCARAFADNPGSAEVATMLAKAELDRGRSRQALDWAKKAVALDEDHANAYVFLGGAEQAIGHAAAAKAAYRRYLQLSPQGRYAAELRMVLGTL